MIKLKDLLNERMDRKKAAIILKQIGGNRFIAMTGAKGFTFSDKYMSFKIGRNSKGIKVKKKVKGVYNDMLGKIFTKYTGMRTSLCLI